MSTARFQPRLSLCLLFAALLINTSPGQGQATISIMIAMNTRQCAACGACTPAGKRLPT